MENKKNISQQVRTIHRTIGYFIAGMVIVFVFSGIMQIYRNTDFLKVSKDKDITIAPNLQANELGRALRLRDFKVEKEENGIVYFENGTYNSQTGEAKYVAKELPAFLDKMTELHTSSSKRGTHYFTLLFAVLLLGMVISSFWMYKPNTKTFKKGMIYVLIGVAVSILLIIF